LKLGADLALTHLQFGHLGVELDDLRPLVVERRQPLPDILFGGDPVGRPPALGGGGDQIRWLLPFERVESRLVGGEMLASRI
jgi:hypothetical protein